MRSTLKVEFLICSEYTMCYRETKIQRRAFSPSHKNSTFNTCHASWISLLAVERIAQRMHPDKTIEQQIDNRQNQEDNQSVFQG